MNTVQVAKGRVSGPLLVAIAAALLQGCMHTAGVSLPALPDSYRNVDGPSAAISDRAWWETLGDPELSKLISQAMRGNFDLEVAGARIAAARARLGTAASSAWPQIGATTRSAREKMSQNGLLGSSAGGAFPDTYTVSTVGLDASWELDLFGAHAAERRQAAARYRQSTADREAVRLSLTAEIARVYVEHIAYAQQLASASDIVNLSRQRLELTEQQFANGQIAEAEVRLAALALESARETATLLRAETEVRREAMGVLLGSGDATVLPERSALLGEDLARANAHIADDTGLPSDLLRRRPDIRRAEAGFEAAIADRAIAVADLYPRFSLVASSGHESLQRGSLLESASRFWALAPQVTLPVLDGGRRKSVVSERDAQVAAATAEYRKSAMNALSDVEQALIRHRAALRAMDSSLAALAHAKTLVTLEQARYEQGETAKPQLFAAQSDYERRRQATLESKKRALLSLVALYKSLGGEPQEVSG
jgi:NodT family efflux transporter outer membrane factor (OMF) lipoprotein